VQLQIIRISSEFHQHYVGRRRRRRRRYCISRERYISRRRRYCISRERYIRRRPDKAAISCK
jgi:hypothetical protein